MNSAPREALLRVPGFGTRNVRRILNIRRFHRLTASDLTKLRIPLRRSEPFIKIEGSIARELDSLHLPARFKGRAEQLSLFDAPKEARTGEF